MNTLLLATTNPGKTCEMLKALGDLPLELIDLTEFPSIAPVAETGSTFKENAALKACGYAVSTGHFTIADDSGLEVDALGGRPGVHSARYGPPGANDQKRIEVLLDEMRSIPHGERHARFRSVTVLASPDGREVAVFEGECSGTIATRPAGSNGFGYDPIFIPDGCDRSFGELPPELKARISHRALALNKLIRFLPDFTGV